jgi:cephalosporin hydroxylase
MTEIRGMTEYKEFVAYQHDNFCDPFRKFLPEINPKRIIEVGTTDGGVVAAVQDIMKTFTNDFVIRTYDIVPSRFAKNLKDRGIDARVENLFTPDYKNWNPEKIDELREFVNQKGTTLVLCDGGDKVNEVRLFSDIIKKNDFIMCHDYAESVQYFDIHLRDKIWNWMNINGSEIQESIEKHKLVPYMKDEFQAVVWGCFQKTA